MDAIKRRIRAIRARRAARPDTGDTLSGWGLLALWLLAVVAALLMEKNRA